MNFETLSQNLLIQSRSFVPQWLPGGIISGREYKTASIQGGKGESFSVNLDTGRWAEFAGDLKGGDLISLYAAIKGISQGDAYKQLGGPSTNGEFPSLHHSKHGDPSAYWLYRSAAGNPIFCVARYNTSTGKEFLPWRPEAGHWICKALRAPRPLYGLDLLAANSEAPVLVCEGEKAADAARVLAPQFIVVTWPNGAKAWQKADWTVVGGRSVALWPDADDPGVKAMQGIAKLLQPMCPTVKLLNVSNHKDGWDAADALAENFSKEELSRWIESTVRFAFEDSFKRAGGHSLDRDEASVSPEFSDDALALIFTKQHAADWRYIKSWGDWMIWNGKCWHKEPTLRSFDLVRLVCRQKATQCGKPNIATKIASAFTVAAVERLTRADRRHAATIELWDQDPWLLNTPGGIVDLRTGEITPNRREVFRPTYLTPVLG